MYRLCTLTYRTAQVSYLAQKCLEVLGNELAETNPNAGRVIIENFYMDDLLVGVDSEEELEEQREAIHEKLQSAGSTSRKYATNFEELMRSLDMSLIERIRIVFIVDKSAVLTLGMS